MKDTKLLVFTDLDASLLNEDYSYEEAMPAIRLLQDQGYPIVLNSSKTISEMKQLATELNLDSPIISENGGFVSYPEGFTSEGAQSETLGLSRESILEKAHALRSQYGYDFSGFSDWSVAEIAAHTGLSLPNADLASQRYITEPILWNDSEERLTEFLQQMQSIDAKALLGGRFIHLMGAFDKADGLNKVKAIYEKKEPNTSWVTVALGDSPNDQEMLNAADVAVIIPHLSGVRLEKTLASETIIATKVASAGWNEAILNILNNKNLT